MVDIVKMFLSRCMIIQDAPDLCANFRSIAYIIELNYSKEKFVLIPRNFKQLLRTEDVYVRIIRY